MSIDILTISEWEGNNRIDTVIESPTWDQIELAIRALNNKNLNDLYLQPLKENEDTYLAVGGGQQRHIASGSINNRIFPTVVDSTKSTDTYEELLVGGQIGQYPSNMIVDIDVALYAAKSFFELGTFDGDINWQNL